VGGTFSPVPAVTFRANYAKAVRAPSIFELFRPSSTQLTNLATDPCSGAAPTTNLNLRAVCLAQGAPLTSIGSILDPAAGQANVTVVGSTALQPETAKTLTVGVLLQPETFLSGFNMSLDYYRINVTDAINAALPGDLLAECFGSLSASSATNPACTSIRRNPTTGRLSGSVVNTFGLSAPLTNAGRLFTDGFDLIANYRRDLGFAELDLNFSGNYTRRSFFDASQANPANVFPNCPGVYSANCGIAIGGLQPKWSWSQRTTLGFDGIDLSLLWRHISKFEYEYINNPGPAPAPNPNNLPRSLFVGNITGVGPFVGQSVNLNRIDSYDYFDLSARFEVTDNFSLTASVFNLLDKDAPLLGGQAGTTSANSGNTFPSTYDVLGRRYSVTARLQF
jgi:outer membrane receptor protein involved in Fe transport